MAQPENEMTLGDVVAFFRRNIRLIAGFVLAFGVVTGVVLLLVVEKQYEASVTLVIVPPKLASELKPQSLSVQSYQKILESDSVLEEVRKRLLQKGIAVDRYDFRIGTLLETRIFVSRQREDVTLAPMIQAIVRAPSADQAATTANIWAEVFTGRVRDLVAGSTSSAVQFVEQQFPSVRDDLAKAEDGRATVAGELQRRNDDVATGWEARVSTYRVETAALVAAHDSESTRLLSDLSGQRNLETHREQLKVLRKVYGDLQDEQARVSSDLAQKKLQLEGLRAALEKTPPYLTLHKAITDDALWQAAGRGADAPDWKAIEGRTLATQERNPVYTELSTRAASAEAEVAALTPRGAMLEERVAALAADLKTLEVSVSADESELDKLKSTRLAGLAKLQEERKTGLAALERRRDQELTGLKLDTDTRLAQLDRTIGQQRDLFSVLSKSYNQAALAKGQVDFEDVRVGAAAVPDPVPLKRNRLLKTGLAGLIGAVFGMGVALVREAWGTPTVAA